MPLASIGRVNPISSTTRESLAVPRGVDAVLLVVALTGISFSGPLMAATAAPALAIAFWRNALGALPTAGVVGLRHRAELVRMPARAIAGAVLAGCALAAHFATWVPSVTMTSVASATALVSTQIVFTAVIAHWQGRRLPRLAWVGIGAATIATGLITGADIELSTRALAGDLLGRLLRRLQCGPATRLPDRRRAARRLSGRCLAEDRARDDMRPAARAQPAQRRAAVDQSDPDQPGNSARGSGRGDRCLRVARPASAVECHSRADPACRRACAHRPFAN